MDTHALRGERGGKLLAERGGDDVRERKIRVYRRSKKGRQSWIGLDLVGELCIAVLVGVLELLEPRGEDVDLEDAGGHGIGVLLVLLRRGVDLAVEGSSRGRVQPDLPT